MAIVKHIKSRNANYSAAINYLLFEHDEKTGKKIVDESGRSILRKEFYMDGLNCDPMSFDKECELTNAHFHKNKKREDIKSHHYIISYDPADVTEMDLPVREHRQSVWTLQSRCFPDIRHWWLRILMVTMNPEISILTSLSIVCGRLQWKGSFIWINHMRKPPVTSIVPLINS